MNRALTALLLALCASIAQAESGITVDAGYSDCRHTPSPNGQWWTNDQQHQSRLDVKCGTFGLSAQINPAWRLGVHWVSLGRPEVNAYTYACPQDDCTQLVRSSAPSCNNSFQENCQYSWNTTTYTRGINFSAAYHLFSIGNVSFDAKGGLYAHKLSSHAIVEPNNCRDNCPWRIQVDQSAERITPMWGGVVTWKFLYASWEFYERIGEHTPVSANVKGRVEVKTIGVRIPLRAAPS